MMSWSDRFGFGGRMMRKAARAAFLIFAIGLGSFAIGWHACAGEQQMADAAASRYRVTDADLQDPELPTGCEATAGATLLRLNGISATKTEVADAMPRGDNWVHEFWGNPYDESGWAIMAPGMAHTLNKFVRAGEGVLDYTGCQLDTLPVPCEVWVTMGLEEPTACQELEGYKLMHNTHCMVVLYVGGYAVHVIDPLKGETDYPRALFEQRYAELGKQAIYIVRE